MVSLTGSGTVGYPGLDPAWSRRVTAVDADGVRRTWHLLDNLSTLTTEPAGTLLCVHGNPTWSYLWRDLVRAAARWDQPWRVIAVDQLDMGLSDRTGAYRGLDRRVDDLTAVTDALSLDGPVVTVGHDWGGAISLGWALRHRDRLTAVVLTNTAVHQPADSSAPMLIRLARLPGILPMVTVRTPTFLRVTLALANPRLRPDVRTAFLAPYRGPARRGAIGDFVADIPLGPQHRSWAALTQIADGIKELADVPTLLLWGPRDPVFGEAHLRDLRGRLPHADLHRYNGAGHLLPQDADIAHAIHLWLTRPEVPPHDAPVTTSPRRPLWASLTERAQDSGAALVEMDRGGHSRTVSWSLLHQRTEELAAGLLAHGVRPGDRIALLVPPGGDLTALLYACLRIGAVIVVADAGLGLRGLNRAIRSADPAYIVCIGRGLVAAAALRWPGRRIAVGALAAAAGRALGARLSLAGLVRAGAGRGLPVLPDLDADAAVLFTSGSTGPAKGVVYTHRQLERLRDTLAATYGVEPGSALVAAFAPFALLGPALGATSVVPEMDITAPRTLTATALAQAAHAANATMVFTSPAALTHVLDTTDQLSPTHRGALGRIQLLLSAGAPIPASLLRRAVRLMPAASVHTPYGMTEALCVTDIDLDQIDEAGMGNGVCVGRPVTGVEIAISALDPAGAATGPLGTTAEITGEIVVKAAHVKERYDKLWVTQQLSARELGWHRTGDVGHVDSAGRLWVEGRLAHVITTADGVLTPVGVEQRVQTLPGVARAALVGVGPTGAQIAVVVVESRAVRRAGLASVSLVDSVRSVAGIAVAAVLVVTALPTDIRHNSKIDRTRVARWAAAVLAGRTMGSP